MSESVAISRTDLAKVTEQRFVRNGCVRACACVCARTRAFSSEKEGYMGKALIVVGQQTDDASRTVTT